MNNTGDRIKSIRIKMGLNQTDFAAKLRLGGPAIVSKYERGQREPEIATLTKISKLGNKSLDWLLTGKAASVQKDVDKKLGKLTAQLERIYHEGDSKTISGVQIVLDLADPRKTKRKKK